MIEANRRYRSLVALALVAATTVFALGGCTVIRYVNGKPPGGGGGGGGGEPDPKVVDMLVQANLERSSSAFVQDYQGILERLTASLAKKNVTVRRAALAPMYRRSGGTVPLVYGKEDPKGDFHSFQEAFAFYTRDDAKNHLKDRSAVDGENLAALGLNLDSRSVTHPKSADPSARGYFRPPKDGFVVVSLTATERRCGASDKECKLDATHPGTYFARKGGSGSAAWLNLPGDEGLAPSKIYHLAITPPEGVGYGKLRNNCRSYPNFPASKLDFMTESEKAYFGPLVDRIKKKGGRGRHVDLCKAMSSRRKPLMKNVAGHIRKMF